MLPLKIDCTIEGLCKLLATDGCKSKNGATGKEAAFFHLSYGP